MKTPGFEENVSSSMYSHTGVYMHYSTKAKCYYIVQLFTKPSANQATDFPTIAEAVVTGNVNVRSGPGTNYKKLGKLRRGQTVAVWSITGKWAEITWTGNQKGYVHTDYLRMDAE